MNEPGPRQIRHAGQKQSAEFFASHTIALSAARSQPTPSFLRAARSKPSHCRKHFQTAGLAIARNRLARSPSRATHLIHGAERVAAAFPPVQLLQPESTALLLPDTFVPCLK